MPVIELNENCETYTQYVDTEIQLKAHQLTLLKACIDHENTKNSIESTDIGIIGDNVGSGKSYIILSLIMCNKKPKHEHKYIINHGLGHYSIETRYNNYINVNSTLLVIPFILLKQWIGYINTFSSKITYYVINSKKSLDKFYDMLITNESFDIIIVVNTFYGKLYTVCNNKFIKYNRVIFDEADSIKVSTLKNASFYWFVTASYKNLLYYKHGNIIRQICSDITISNLKIYKNNNNYIKSSFGLIEPLEKIVSCKSTTEIHILSGLVTDAILNCLNAGDINGALKKIPSSNVNTEENVISKVLEDLYKKYSNNEVILELYSRMEYDNIEDKERDIKNTNITLNKIQTKIDLLKTRIKDSNMCIICYSDIEHKTVCKQCNNCYCLNCITTWLKNKRVCPLCKTDATIDKDFYVIHTDESITNTNLIESKQLTKLENLKQILRNRHEKDKFLIFSDYENSFNSMYTMLDELNVPWSQIKGNSVYNTINNYKTNTIDVLLVNSSYYGSGMNLENTTDIILFHKFSTDIYKQVIGRAQRPGRTQQLRIWYLLHDNEILV